MEVEIIFTKAAFKYGAGKETIRELCVLVVLVLLIFSLAACSGGQSESPFPEEEVEPTPSVAEENGLDEIAAPEIEIVEPEIDFDSIPIGPQDFTGNNNLGGYVAVHDGLFYYSNQDDENKLYRMDENSENETKLSDRPNTSTWLYIQAEGDSLFYIQTEEIEETVVESGWTIRTMCTLYSYDLSTNAERKLVDNNIYTYVVSEGWIYFSTLDDNRIYRMKTDGSSTEILTEGIEPMAVQLCNDRLYYKHSESLGIMNLDGSSIIIFYYPMYAYYAYNDEIFDGRGAITKRAIKEDSIGFSEDGEFAYGEFGPTVTILEEEISAFDYNIFHQRIYYATLDGKIFRMNMDGSNPQYIADGSAPIVFSNYVFYLDKDDRLTWVANNG